MEYLKAKSAAKVVVTPNSGLHEIVSSTMKTIREVVGGTLGPGGRPVLIERQEAGLPPFVTKDGVTVFRSIGFQGSVEQAVMEVARDASIRTADEAGDGTTTASILSEALVENINTFCQQHQRYSPQLAVRELSTLVEREVIPYIESQALEVSLDEEGYDRAYGVAMVSGNGDSDLADAVMECFDIVGDAGNITIVDSGGPNSYEANQVRGYSAEISLHECCRRYATNFINDTNNNRCVLENPIFILYNGKVMDIGSVQMLLEQIGEAWESYGLNHNVVLVAHEFSEGVLATLALNFTQERTINVFPLITPRSIMQDGQLSFLQDVQAIAACAIFDPINKPAKPVDLKTGLCDLGFLKGTKNSAKIEGPVMFEIDGSRCNIVGAAPEGENPYLLKRIASLETQVKNAPSMAVKDELVLKLAKITNGLARLVVSAPSVAERRERRDRAEDAICAVRGAIKHGCLPGGGVTWVDVIDSVLSKHTEPVAVILKDSIEQVVFQLYSNAGFDSESIRDRIMVGLAKGEVVDITTGETRNAKETHLVDSAPAVTESLRNSLSVASQLGTLAGAVVFARNYDIEKQQARDSAEFERTVNHNFANTKA